jgi:cytochrome c peroxidase
MKRWRLALVIVCFVAYAAAFGTTAATQTPTTSQKSMLRPSSVRTAAAAAGLKALSTVPVPVVDNLNNFLKSSNPARTAAVRLGKAFFWDTQAGTDGQACGSCHFHAGADSRTRNQLSPGLKNVNPGLRNIFNPTASGTIGPSGYCGSGVGTCSGGPDYDVIAADFPFHQVEFPEENNFNNRGNVLFDTDDVLSSQGVFNGIFGSIDGSFQELGTAVADSTFNTFTTPGGPYIAENVRRVEPRNTPTMINAVFTHSNFWDGRAHNQFNGVTVLGPLDTNATVWINNGVPGAAPATQRVLIPNSSLASQAVGPPQNTFEMSFADRPFPLIGRKLLGLRPLGTQLVDPTDSVLGSLSRAPDSGLNTTYAELIKAAFQDKYWNGGNVVVPGVGTVSQMEANFTLFWGLAIQMYESTLISDRSPFDRFMVGDNTALEDEQLLGLLVFLNRGPGNNPIEVDRAIGEAGVPIGIGNCVSCHSGPEFTAAALTSLGKNGKIELIEIEDAPQLVDGFLQSSEEQAIEDDGFSNIGVRPAFEDLGRGADGDFPFPLSFSRQALQGLTFLLPPGAELECTVDCPARVQVDGAFKIPSLRNVELTGPFFHNGGHATLEQVVEFYDRQSDFGDVNIENLDVEIALIDLDEADEDPLVEFLLSLTDPRVRHEQGPFDHPALTVPNGGTLAAPQQLLIPAVGAGGRPAKGLPPLKPFLQ